MRTHKFDRAVLRQSAILQIATNYNRYTHVCRKTKGEKEKVIMYVGTADKKETPER